MQEKKIFAISRWRSILWQAFFTRISIKSKVQNSSMITTDYLSILYIVHASNATFLIQHVRIPRTIRRWPPILSTIEALARLKRYTVRLLSRKIKGLPSWIGDRRRWGMRCAPFFPRTSNSSRRSFVKNRRARRVIGQAIPSRPIRRCVIARNKVGRR